MRAPFGIMAIALLLVGALILSLAASNTVTASRMVDYRTSIGPNNLKPGTCSFLTLTSTLTGAGDITGTSASELILGGPAVQTIRGGGGNDCILGGGGNDTLQGDTGIDVCIGGPGTDTFKSSCELQVQ